MASFDSLGPPFEKDTPVLRLTYGKDPLARWVLWPLFAWRVVAPVPEERKLNLFQRAVLGFARAKVTTIVGMADRLLLAPDLVGLIVLELQNMALLDHAGEPTARGLSMLAEVEDDPPDQAQVGHVLSDPFTGKLWPRFLTGDLPIADVESNDDGWPVLLSGSAGDPWRDRTFSVLPTGRDNVVIARPNAWDVLRAARRHRRQRDYDDVDDDRDVPRLQRVSFVDDRPQPYLLALRVRRHASGDWMVDDPFGHGEAFDLRARLEERLDHHEGLRRWLAPVVGSDPEAPRLDALHQEAAWDVETRLTLDIRRFQGLYPLLVAMQRARLEAERLDAPADKWDDATIKAQRAAERLFRDLHEPYRFERPPYSQELSEIWAFSRGQIAHAAQAAGLVGKAPVGLCRVSRGQVADAESRGRGSLRSLMALAILAARWNDAHPMRRLLRDRPDVLRRLDDLATARNQAAHDGQGASAAAVPRFIDAVYDAVNLLLPLS